VIFQHPVEGGSGKAQGQECGYGGYRGLPLAIGFEQRDLPEHLPRPERPQGHGTIRPFGGHLGMAGRDQVQPVARIPLCHHDAAGWMTFLAQEIGQLLQRPSR
jgi:hypothetical protein